MDTEEDFHNQPTIPPLVPIKKPIGIPKTPEKIGPYKIESLLEKGGMSFLYIGTHPESKDPCTIKVLSPKYLTNPEVVNRFLKEAEIISMTNHTNIVKLYGQGQWEGGLYIAMEFIEGISLRQYLLQTPLSLKRALEIILDISYALCHLHTHGVIHRDLKPENILVTEEGYIKVIDFGIAQLLTETPTSGAPPKQRLIGTPIYMSPEQRDNPETVSFPSDIYSLGIIAYELILGRLSHGQIHLSLMPKGIQPIFHKCLQPKIEDRYQDVADLLGDLTTFARSPFPEKEGNIKDQMNQLAEDLRLVQRSLSLPKSLQAPHVEIGSVCYQGAAVGGVYYHFSELSEGCFAACLGEPAITGAEGIITTAITRGMIQALADLSRKPQEWIAMLNTLLVNDPFYPVFALNYLLVDPYQNNFRYFSAGNAMLWHYEAQNGSVNKIELGKLALGLVDELSIVESQGSWEPGDVLLMHTFSTLSRNHGQPTFFDEEMMIQALKDSSKGSAQKQVENILRKAKLTIPYSSLNRSITLISIKHIP